MTKIKIMSVRDEDLPYIEEWSKRNNIEVDLSREQLTEDNVETVPGTVSLSQTLPISEEIYKKLESFGIKQIAQRSADLMIMI